MKSCLSSKLNHLARVSLNETLSTDPRTAPQAARQENRTAPVRKTRSKNHPKNEIRERACFLRLPVLSYKGSRLNGSGGPVGLETFAFLSKKDDIERLNGSGGPVGLETKCSTRYRNRNVEAKWQWRPGWA